MLSIWFFVKIWSFCVVWPADYGFSVVCPMDFHKLLLRRGMKGNKENARVTPAAASAVADFLCGGGVWGGGFIFRGIYFLETYFQEGV